MKLFIYSVRPAQNGAIVDLQPLAVHMIPAARVMGPFTNLLNFPLLRRSALWTPRQVVESLSAVTLACMAVILSVIRCSELRASSTAAPARPRALISRLNSLLVRLKALDNEANALLSALPRVVKSPNDEASDGTMALASELCVAPSVVTLLAAAPATVLERPAAVLPLEPTNRAALARKAPSRARRASTNELSVLTRP